MNGKTQNGYVLVMMLLVVMSTSAGWFAFSANQNANHRPGLPLVESQRLADARQAMLSYAALYHYLYGPAGAGPGHLPCPDTDGYALPGSALESGSLQRRDGANPPCASMIEVDGYLPRHTVLPGIRYLFHAEPWQRYDYRVADQLINNPVNRIVNLDTLNQADQQLLAVISVASPDDVLIRGQVAISGKSLRFAMASSVAAWVVARAAEAASVDAYSPCESDRLLALVFDKPLNLPSKGCLADSPDRNSIEGVSAVRHWFYRNQWHAWVNVVYEPGCDAAALNTGDCRLVLPVASRNGVSKTDNSIMLFLRRN